MAHPLSNDAEAFIAGLFTGGIFPTREAVLERCVAALRHELDSVPMVPPEHMEAVEAGFDSLEKYGAIEFTPEVRDRILERALARAAAERAKAAG